MSKIYDKKFSDSNGKKPGDVGFYGGSLIKVDLDRTDKNATDALRGTTVNNTLQAQDSIIADSYINSSGVLSSNAGYDVQVYVVSYNDIKRVEAQTSGTGIMVYAFYRDALCTDLVSGGTIHPSATVTYDEYVSVPYETLYLAVTKSGSRIANVYEKSGNIKEEVSTVGDKADLLEVNTTVFNDKIDPDTVIDNTYLDQSGTKITNVAYRLNVYATTVDELRLIKCDYQVGYGLRWAYYTDVACTNVVELGDLTAIREYYEETLRTPANALYLAVCDKKSLFQYTYKSTEINSEAIEKLNTEVFGDKKVECAGDSLTYGDGSTTGFAFPAQLQDILGNNYNVINRGVSGTNTNAIGSKSGGLGVVCPADFTLPADTSQVNIGASLVSTFDGSGISLSKNSETGVSPIYVDGTACTLSWNGSAYFLNRVAAGTSSKLIIANTTFTTDQARIDRNVEILNLYHGTNGGWNLDVDEYIAKTNAMINYKQCDKFLIIGIHSVSGGNVTKLQELEAACVKEYGSRYLNVREYMMYRGLTDAGKTPTQADIDAIAIGAIPPSLLSDILHFNDEGYTLLTNYIYSKYVELNYIV